MVMTNGEIITSYRQAANQKDQILVLAQLNGTDTGTMRQKLRDLGFDVGEPLLRERDALDARASIVSDVIARPLFEEGKTDAEIAEVLSVSKYAVAAWRTQNGLYRRKGKVVPPAGEKNASAKKKGTEAAKTAKDKANDVVATLTLKQLADLLAPVAHDHPGAVVLVNGKAVLGMQVVTEVDLPSGVTRAVFLNLKTEKTIKA